MRIISKWDPFRDLSVLQDRVNRVFNEQFTNQAGEEVSNKTWAPAVDILETDGELVVRVEIPGVDKNDVDIEVTSESLTIKGERKFIDADKDKFIRVERTYGAFQRSFNIGVPIQPDDVKAKYKDGVLEIIVPKAEEIKPKKISIKLD